MCVIVHQPGKTYLDKETAQQMWGYNDDGGGFAYIDHFENTIKVEKFLEFAPFWKAFEKARSAHRNTEFLVHFRIATSGKVSLENVHPFEVDEYTVMAHNGILNHIVGSIPITAEYSDTREFVDLILPELPEDWLDNPVLVDMMEDYIGGSKLMFLTTNPRLSQNVYILNEQKGVKRNGMWWSNDNHEPRPVRTFVTTWSDHSSGKSKLPALPSEGTNKVYQLPLPRDTESLAETQAERLRDEEIIKFWETTADEEIGARCEVLPDLSLDELLKERREMGLDSDLVWDPEEEMYECQKCYDFVEVFNGDCMCWDMICIECGNLAPYCFHDSNDADLVTLKNAPAAFNERMKGDAFA